MYDVDRTVTNEHLLFSAQTAVAFDEVIRRHDIYAFGFYWWGERELTTQLRAQAGLAVSVSPPWGARELPKAMSNRQSP